MHEQLLLIIGITALCMLSPGPDMALVMRSTLIGGRQNGGMTATGILTGNLIHIGYCALGIGWIISRSVIAFNILKFAGAAYLIYLGIRSLRAAGGKQDWAADTDWTVHSKPPSSRAAYVQGLINNLLNPKGTLFYLGVFSQVITPETSTPEKLVLIAVMIGVSTLFWIVFIHTLHLPAIRSGLSKARDSIERVFGIALIFLGLRVATLDQ